MRPFLPAVILLLLAMHPGQASASTIYRCVGKDAVIRFQDRPCLADESSRRIELANPPPAAETSTDDADFSESVDKPDVESAPVRQTPLKTLSSAILCTREDGSRYLSETGHGVRRQVPLGMLGVPNESLADAYGGRDSIGVSAPGLRDPPLDHSGRGRLGALYTWVEDPCERIEGARLCEFLDRQVADAERRLRMAFSDTSAQVRNELELLRKRAGECSD